MFEGSLKLLVHQAVDDGVQEGIEVMKPLCNHHCLYLNMAFTEIPSDTVFRYILLFTVQFIKDTVSASDGLFFSDL